MPSVQGLLQRWGFVKLRRYGLELTPDGRILSTRPVLDDGIGGRIVGWRDGDVAIWKLSSWKGERSEPSVVADLATPVAMPQSVVPAVQPPPALSAKSAITKPSTPAPEPLQPSAAAMDVAAGPTVDEDDWEWTIALARARVAVEETEVARPPEPPIRRLRAERPTPPLPASRDSATSSEWPKTEPRTTTPTTPTTSTAPNTVIPVPALPSMATMATPGRSRMEPVVRSAQVLLASASRFAKGTGTVDPPTTHSMAVLVEDTIPNLSVGDRTRPGVAMPPASRRAAEAARSSVGDRTKPGIALPPAARAVELPSVKRRMSPR